MLSIRETIRALGASRIARASGLPLTTICRWRDEDRIPGKGPAHDWRMRQFEQAARAVREASGAATGTSRIDDARTDDTPKGTAR